MSGGLDSLEVTNRPPTGANLLGLTISVSVKERTMHLTVAFIERILVSAARPVPRAEAGSHVSSGQWGAEAPSRSL